MGRGVKIGEASSIKNKIEKNNFIETLLNTPGVLSSTSGGDLVEYTINEPLGNVGGGNNSFNYFTSDADDNTIYFINYRPYIHDGTETIYYDILIFSDTENGAMLHYTEISTGNNTESIDVNVINSDKYGTLYYTYLYGSLIGTMPVDVTISSKKYSLFRTRYTNINIENINSISEIELDSILNQLTVPIQIDMNYGNCIQYNGTKILARSALFLYSCKMNDIPDYFKNDNIIHTIIETNRSLRAVSLYLNGSYLFDQNYNQWKPYGNILIPNGEPTIFNTNSKITSSTTFYELLKHIITMDRNLNYLKKYVSDGKAAVAQAITQKGVATENDDTFETIVSNIGKISGGGGINFAHLSVKEINVTDTITGSGNWVSFMQGYALSSYDDSYIIVVVSGVIAYKDADYYLTHMIKIGIIDLTEYANYSIYGDQIKYNTYKLFADAPGTTCDLNFDTNGTNFIANTDVDFSLIFILKKN